MQKAKRYVIEMAVKKGIPCRVDIAQGSFEEAKPWIEIGVRHFVICRDLDTIANYFQQQGEGMRKLLSSI